MIIQGSAFALSILCLSWIPSALYDWLSCPEYLRRTLHLVDKDANPEPPITAEQVKRVGIIGAGTAGLAALKTFLYDIPKPDGQRWEIEVFEQRHDLGGIWLPDDSSTHYPRVPETPLYPRLRAIGPGPIMAFPGFPYPPHTPLYPFHAQVEAYHRSFASHFDLYPYIRFNHSVESVQWVGDASTGFWELSISTSGPQVEIVPLSKTSVRNARHRSRITRCFDHLVVAGGHFHFPKFPQWATNDVANQWSQNGKGRRIVHSVYFRDPEEFTGKIVLIVGSGPSGEDIAIHINGHAKKIYHSLSGPGRPPPREVPGVIYKPRTKGFTSSSVQFEDGTEVYDLDVVVLGTGYEYRFPFLDPSDSYNQLARGLPTNERHIVVTTNASAHSRPEEEQRLTENLKYLFPLDKQIVSLSSLHPLNALLFINLPLPSIHAPNSVAQSTFAGHLIARPDRVYPTSHITGHEGWNETLARELLLKNLTAFEKELADEGFDVYRLGHRTDLESTSWHGYQDSLIAYLQSQGLVPRHDGGYIFAEPWRVRAVDTKAHLRIIWEEVENRGEEEVERWLDEVETEEEWADLMDRLLKWGEEHGI